MSGLAPIVVLYLALALYRIDEQSLWTDEVISVKVASAAEPIWTRMYSQSPLYFILLGLWSKLIGTTEFALRSFSTLLGIGAVCITYGIGYKLIGRRTALLTAILLATSPYLIWYAQEVRYITLLLVTSLLMTYSFHRAISGGLWKWWLSYSVTSLMALFTFVTVIFLIIAQGLYVFFRASHRPMLRKWMTCQLVTLLGIAIWFAFQSGPELTAALTKAPTVVAQEQRRLSETLPVSDALGTIPYTFFVFSVGFSVGPSVTELHQSRAINTLLGHAPILTPLGILFVTVFVLGLWKLRNDRDTAIFLLLWLIVPIVGAFIVATTTTYHVYNTRYVAMTLPAYILILATGVTEFGRRRIQIALLAALLIVNGISLGNYYFDTHYDRADARSAAQYLDSAARPGDIIVVVGNLTALRHYYKGELPIVPVDGELRQHSSVSGNLPELLKGHDCLWLVEIRQWETDPKGNVKATLDNLAHRGAHKRFPGVSIYPYTYLSRRS